MSVLKFVRAGRLVSCRRHALLGAVFAIFAAQSMGANVNFDSIPAAAPSTASDVHVTDTAGKPVQGVVVLLQDRPEALLPDMISETTVSVSNGDGLFKAPDKVAGGALVVLRKTGFASPAFNASKPLPSSIVLEPAAVLSGQVMTSDGKPVPGAIVGPPRLKSFSVESGHLGLLPRQLAVTDDNGVFKLGELTSASLQVQIVADGFMPRLFDAQAGQALKIALSTDGTEVSGTVVGSHDRMPQPSIWVQATGQGIELAQKTDANGIFVFRNMPKAAWVFRPAGGGPVSGTQSNGVTVDVPAGEGGTSVSLVLNQGVRVAGTVINAETSEPMAGVGLVLTGYNGSASKSAVSGAGGTFAFEDLDALSDFSIRFDALHYVNVLPGGATRDYFQLPRTPDLDLSTVTIPLRRRAGIVGHVVDSSGRGAEDVEVIAEALDAVTSSADKMGRRTLRYNGFSSPTGDYTIGVYPGGRYKVWGTRGANEVSNLVTLETFTTAPATRADLQISQGKSLGGMVLDADDKPVTAAVVIAYPANSSEPIGEPYQGSDLYRYTKSGPDGTFGFSNLTGEKLTLRATQPSFVVPVYLTVEPGSPDVATTDQVKMKFPGGGDIFALVTDEEGKPISQATVNVEYRVGLDGKSASSRTDAYGHAQIRSLPVNQVEKITVTHPVFADFSTEGPNKLPLKDFVAKLSKRPSITVNVTVGGSVPPTTPALEVLLLQAPTSANDEGKTPPDGKTYQQYSRSAVVGGKAAFPNVANGWYKAALGGGGKFAESDPLFAGVGGGDKVISLELPASAKLQGRVFDKASNAGLPGSVISIRPAAESAQMLGGTAQTVVAKENGEFEFEGIGQGSLIVKAAAQNYPDYEETVQATPGQKLEIGLSNAPGALAGKVTSGGNPVANAMLVLSRPGATDSPVATSITDASGHYRLTGFAVGSYNLMCEAPIGTGDNISHKNVAVTVDDESATKDLDFAALVSVTGRVTAGGKPAVHDDGSTVSILFMPKFEGGEPQTVGVGADGRYAAQVAPGKYSVGLEDQAVGREVEVPTGAEYELNLDF